jgi:hypothetical protein
MDVCVCVCVCARALVPQHKSGKPGAISTKLGTHMTICMYTNLMYIIYIYIYIHEYIYEIQMDVCMYVCMYVVA